MGFSGLFGKMADFIGCSPGIVMIVSGMLGLVFSYGHLLPDFMLAVLVAGIIFLSCFRINAPLPRNALWRIPVFCVLRYVAFPLLMWWLCMQIAPEYAVGMLLLGLCPAGSSSAGFASIYNGNVSTAIAITVFSSIACVAFMPVMFGVFAGLEISVSPWQLLRTLSLCVLLPGALYLILRSNAAVVGYFTRNGQNITVLMLGAIVFLALARNQDTLIQNHNELLLPFSLIVGFYMMAMIAGFAIKTSLMERISYGICSTFNNNALGIGIAGIYFDSKVVVFMVMTSIVWMTLPIIARPVIKNLSTS